MDSKKRIMSLDPRVHKISIMQDGNGLSSDIRRQQIILDTPLYAFNAGLQQPTSFQANPDTKHRCVARAHCLQEGLASTKLSENRKGTRVDR